MTLESLGPQKCPDYVESTKGVLLSKGFVNCLFRLSRGAGKRSRGAFAIGDISFRKNAFSASGFSSSCDTVDR
jgi:hypothetical protein